MSSGPLWFSQNHTNTLPYEMCISWITFIWAHWLHKLLWVQKRLKWMELKHGSSIQFHKYLSNELVCPKPSMNVMAEKHSHPTVMRILVIKPHSPQPLYLLSYYGNKEVCWQVWHIRSKCTSVGPAAAPVKAQFLISHDHYTLSHR